MAEKEYIEREKINDYISKLREYVSASVGLSQAEYSFISDILTALENFTAADVAPVKHGHWIKTANTWTHDYNERSKPIYYCSLCGRYEKIKEPYCNCGAKMDEG